MASIIARCCLVSAVVACATLAGAQEPAAERVPAPSKGSSPAESTATETASISLLREALLPAPAAVAVADIYGGTEFFKDKGTGFFRLARGGDGRWWLVTPEGNGFFSHGLNVIRATWTVAPAFRARFGGDRQKWAVSAVELLRNLGMNTIGPDHFDQRYVWLRPLRTVTPRLPYVMVFAPVPFIPRRESGQPRTVFPDVFDPDYERRARRGAQLIAAQVGNDPYLIGYMFHNELNWGTFGIFAGLWADHVGLPATAPGKQAFVEVMRTRYAGGIAAFNAHYGSAEALLAHGRWLLRDGTEGAIPASVRKRLSEVFEGPRAPRFADWTDVASFTDDKLLEMAVRLSPKARGDIEAFLETLSDRYHGVMAAALRAADANHLLLGSKFVGGKTVPLCDGVLRGAAPHVDVICQNVYHDPFKRHAQRQIAFLERSSELTGKPILLSEWGGFHGQDVAPCKCYVPVATQKDRAAAYSHGIRQLAAQPWLLGVYYYSYVDHADLNWGIVDARLVPYPELTGSIRSVSADLAAIHAGTLSP